MGGFCRGGSLQWMSIGGFLQGSLCEQSSGGFSMGLHGGVIITALHYSYNTGKLLWILVPIVGFFPPYDGFIPSLADHTLCSHKESVPFVSSYHIVAGKSL